MTLIKHVLNPSVIIVLFVLFGTVRPVSLNAQGPLVRYYMALEYDENDERLVRPSFAQYENVMNEIYVIDARQRVLIYTSDLFPVLSLGKSRKILNPEGLTVDSNGNLYVVQTATPEDLRNRVSVYNACLKWERDIFFEGFEGADKFVPYRLAKDSKGNLFVAGIRFPGVLIFDADYNLVEIISPQENDRKALIMNVHIDDTGRIYLVSEEEGHIYVYDENRKFIYQFGEKGGSSGKLSRPRAVAVDNNRGWLYVVDYMRHTVNTYDRNGMMLFEFGGMGWGEGWFRFPTDISVNKEGDVMVTDLFNQRVQIFKPY